MFTCVLLIKYIIIIIIMVIIINYYYLNILLFLRLLLSHTFRCDVIMLLLQTNIVQNRKSCKFAQRVVIETQLEPPRSASGRQRYTNGLSAPDAQMHVLLLILYRYI